MYLITGAGGQLGNELRHLLQERAFYADRAALDITDARAVKDFVRELKPQAIINCAAYTNVDKAESEPDQAMSINRHGPANLAACGLPLVHISTDYVFDGCASRPYTEKDAAHPQTVYGRTKLAGEQAVLQTANTAVILRASWLYSSYGCNFLKTMRRLGAEKENLGVVFDQVGSPTYAADLAAAILQILPQIKPGSREIFHYSNEGVASWYDFAVEIMRLSGFHCRVNPIESAQYPTPAVRPAFTVLNKAKIKDTYNLNINHWKESLQLCLSKQF